MLEGIDLYLLVFVVAMVAGCVDAVAGGGGLLTVPTLLLVGLSPAQAIATNKLQGSFGSFFAASYFYRQGQFALKPLLPALSLTFVASILGAGWVSQVDASQLMWLIPLFLMAIGTYTLLSPSLDRVVTKPAASSSVLVLCLLPLIGFYDGFIGPGAGSLYALALIGLAGLSATVATGQAKALNFMSNLGALLFFLWTDLIHWPIGLVMIAGQLVGATLGARAVIKLGVRLIKPTIVVVCYAMSLRILLSEL